MTFLDTKPKKIISATAIAIVLTGAILAGIFVTGCGCDNGPPSDPPHTTDPDNIDPNPTEAMSTPTDSAGTIRLVHEGEGIFSCPETVQDLVSVVQKADGSYEITLIEGNVVVDDEFITINESNGERIIEHPNFPHPMILPDLDELFAEDPTGSGGDVATGDQVFSNVITLSGNSATADARESAVRIEANSRGVLNVRIRRPGEYTIRGNLNNGAITVGYNENFPGGAVTLILDGVNITSPEGPAIRASTRVDALNIRNASGKTNTLRDTRAARPDQHEGPDGPDGGEDDVENTRNAALFSRAPLTITGSGTLNLHGGFAHGIHARGTTLELNGARVNVVAAHANGFRSRRTMTIRNSTVNITANNKGLRAAGAQHGNINIRDGSKITINSGGDSIHADVNINILGNNTNVTATVAGGWKTGACLLGNSRTAVRASNDIRVDGATLVLDSAQHGINTSETLNFSGAKVTIHANERGMRGRHGITLRNTDTRIEISRVGIHGGPVVGRSHITISGGSTFIHWTDFAFNPGLPGGTYPSADLFTHSQCAIGCH
jgi:hypothetical protein